MIQLATRGDLTLDGKNIHGVRAKIRLDLELNKMSAEELIEIATLAATLDFSEEERYELLRKVYTRLAIESPREAIQFMADDIDRNFRTITVALKNLALTAPLEVSSWIDLHNEELRSDSKRLSSRESRILKLEQELAPQLLKTDPDALHARIQNLTPREATILIDGLSQGNKDKEHLKAVMVLARRNQKSDAFARNLVFNFVQKDLSKASQTIEEFQLNESERSSFVMQTATNIGAKVSTDLSHLDELHTWLENEPSKQPGDYMTNALVTSLAMNNENPGQYERTIAKIVELGGGSSADNTILNQFADQTVCIPTCHHSLANRLKSIESPALKKALTDAHQYNENQTAGSSTPQ